MTKYLYRNFAFVYALSTVISTVSNVITIYSMFTIIFETIRVARTTYKQGFLANTVGLFMCEKEIVLKIIF